MMPPILIRGHGDIPGVVQAMKSDALDFVQSFFRELR
jgi:FixJ family two-component response regulator